MGKVGGGVAWSASGGITTFSTGVAVVDGASAGGGVGVCRSQAVKQHSMLLRLTMLISV